MVLETPFSSINKTPDIKSGAFKNSRRLSLGKTLSLNTSLELDKENFQFNDEELERRRRRRNSRAFQQRRKSLTPNTKKKQYIKDMYTTIIKMSSENKINQKNTWSLHLIDHMDDILDEKRDHESADTFNFQKASCTLDASVKIYSYRVDDTWNSSFKILENLTRSDTKKDEVMKNNVMQNNTSKKICVTDTLESNMNNINMKSFELEFQVDPLFQKMSQTFDEGGAKGMLLVNLGVQDGCNLVFDSSETKLNLLNMYERDDNTSETNIHLNSNFLNQKFHSLSTDIRSMSLCPKLLPLLQEIEFLGRQTSNEIWLRKLSVFGDSSGSHLDAEMSSLEVNSNDNHEGMDDCSDNYNDDFVYDDDYMHDVDDETNALQQEKRLQEDLEAGGDEIGAPSKIPTPELNFLPLTTIETQYSPNEAFEQMDSALVESISNSMALNRDEYAYFNKETLDHWAGPKHWKLPSMKHDKRSKLEKPDEPIEKPKKRSTSTYIDFSKAKQHDYNSEFEKSKSSLEQSSLIRTRAEKNAMSLIFPHDNHFTTTDLCTLFTNPRICFMKMLSVRDQIITTEKDEYSHIYNELFDFFQQESTQSNPRDMDNDTDGIDDCYYDMDCQDDGNNVLDQDIDEFMATGLLEAERKVDKVNVKYEKVAKRVDVKNLKANIWNHLSQTIDSEENIDKKDRVMKEKIENHPPHEINVDTKIKAYESFGEVIESVANQVPSNVTVPFYFICILHLANEKGLYLNGCEDLSDFSIEKDIK